MGKRERLGALAGAIVITIALPIAIDQGYVRDNPYLLPALGLVAALLYVRFFVTSDTFIKLANSFYAKRSKLSLIVFIIAFVIVGASLTVAERFAINKSKEHIASLSSAEKAPSPRKIEPFKQLSTPTKIQTKVIYQTKYSKVFVPQTTHIQKPDLPAVSFRVINLKSIGISASNTYNVIAKDVRYDLTAWDLDLDKDDSLCIFSHSEPWIRPGENVYPYSFVARKEVAPLVKNGDKLLGLASISCPECIATKSYLVFAINGQGGWFFEYPKGMSPNLPKISKLIPAIRKNPEKYFSDIPLSARIPIKEFD